MKSKIAHLTMAVLLLVSCYGLYSCRTIKKDRNHADSTATRLEQQKQAWQSESMQEVIIETDDLAFVQPGLSLPAILGLTREDQVAIGRPESGTLFGKKAPLNRRGFARITIRSSAKAAGAKSSSRVEHKQVRTSASISSKEPGAWSSLSIALVIIVVLIIGAIIIASKRD